MVHACYHARCSTRKFGEIYADYMENHQFMDYKPEISFTVVVAR